MPQLVKNEVPTMQETWVRFLGWKDSPEKGNGNLLQYSGQENSMDCIIQGVTKSGTGLSNFTFKVSRNETKFAIVSCVFCICREILYHQAT